jgi:hypothetical protein
MRSGVSSVSSKHISEFVFELSKPIEYASGGDVAEGTSLTVYAPNNQVGKYCALIESQYNRALMDFQMKFSHLNNDENRDKAKEAASELSEDDQQDTILMMLFSSAEIDKCMVAFQELITFQHGGKYASCRVDGIQHLTKPLYEQLSYRDTKALMGKYIVNFINTSRQS